MLTLKQVSLTNKKLFYQMKSHVVTLEGSRGMLNRVSIKLTLSLKILLMKVLNPQDYLPHYKHIKISKSKDRENHNTNIAVHP